MRETLVMDFDFTPLFCLKIFACQRNPFSADMDNFEVFLVCL
jgi:hypothetical protein